MTKDDLVERLARACHMQLEYEDDCEFDAATDEHQAEMRDFGVALTPTIVEFVAEWIEQFAPYEVEPGGLAHEWRTEMGNG